jgi:transcription elongation factor GreA
MNSPKDYYLTEEGLAKLRDELEELKGPRRNELAKRLRIAIQQGDLSENADYHKAKEDQGFLEGRIQEIEAILRRVVVISTNGKANGVIIIGSRVTIAEKGRKPIKYHLVGAQEANPRDGRISNESPIGQALLGHKAGQTIIAETPAGLLEFEIIAVD